jgi:hypothetical protein
MVCLFKRQIPLWAFVFEPDRKFLTFQTRIISKKNFPLHRRCQTASQRKTVYTPFNCLATKMKKTFLLPVVAAHAAALRSGAGFFVEPIIGAAFFHTPLLSPIRR